MAPLLSRRMDTESSDYFAYSVGRVVSVGETDHNESDAFRYASRNTSCISSSVISG